MSDPLDWMFRINQSPFSASLQVSAALKHDKSSRMLVSHGPTIIPQSEQAVLHHSYLASQPHLGTSKQQHLIGSRQPFLADHYRLGNRQTTVTGSYMPWERVSVSLDIITAALLHKDVMG